MIDIASKVRKAVARFFIHSSLYVHNVHFQDFRFWLGRSWHEAPSERVPALRARLTQVGRHAGRGQIERPQVFRFLQHQVEECLPKGKGVPPLNPLAARLAAAWQHCPRRLPS